MYSECICAPYTKFENEGGAGNCASQSVVRYSCRRLSALLFRDHALRRGGAVAGGGTLIRLAIYTAASDD
jgi:hypothetical protein